jgi:hypothetical protein
MKIGDLEEEATTLLSESHRKRYLISAVTLSYRSFSFDFRRAASPQKKKTEKNTLPNLNEPY